MPEELAATLLASLNVLEMQLDSMGAVRLVAKNGSTHSVLLACRCCHVAVL